MRQFPSPSNTTHVDPTAHTESAESLHFRGIVSEWTARLELLEPGEEKARYLVQMYPQAVKLMLDIKGFSENNFHSLSLTDIRNIIYYLGKLAHHTFITSESLGRVSLLHFNWLFLLSRKLSDRCLLLTQLTKDELITFSQVFSGLGMLARNYLLPFSDYSFIERLSDKFSSDVIFYFNNKISGFKVSDFLKFTNGFFFGVNGFLESPHCGNFYPLSDYLNEIINRLVKLVDVILKRPFSEKNNQSYVSDLKNCLFQIKKLSVLTHQSDPFPSSVSYPLHRKIRKIIDDVDKMIRDKAPSWRRQQEPLSEPRRNASVGFFPTVPPSAPSTTTPLVVRIVDPYFGKASDFARTFPTYRP